jgi:hypothetical protein
MLKKILLLFIGFVANVQAMFAPFQKGAETTMGPFVSPSIVHGFVPYVIQKFYECQNCPNCKSLLWRQACINCTEVLAHLPTEFHDFLCNIRADKSFLGLSPFHKQVFLDHIYDMPPLKAADWSEVFAYLQTLSLDETQNFMLMCKRFGVTKPTDVMLLCLQHMQSYGSEDLICIQKFLTQNMRSKDKLLIFKTIAAVEATQRTDILQQVNCFWTDGIEAVNLAHMIEIIGSADVHERDERLSIVKNLCAQWGQEAAPALMKMVFIIKGFAQTKDRMALKKYIQTYILSRVNKGYGEAAECMGQVCFDNIDAVLTYANRHLSIESARASNFSESDHNSTNYFSGDSELNTLSDLLSAGVEGGAVQINSSESDGMNDDSPLLDLNDFDFDSDSVSDDESMPLLMDFLFDDDYLEDSPEHILAKDLETEVNRAHLVSALSHIHPDYMSELYDYMHLLCKGMLLENKIQILEAFKGSNMARIKKLCEYTANLSCGPFSIAILTALSNFSGNLSDMWNKVKARFPDCVDNEQRARIIASIRL